MHARWWMIAILCGAARVVGSQPTTGAGGVDAACTDTSRHGRFVGDSRALVERGTDLRAVLETLTCIATHPEADSEIGTLAVRALFDLAVDDADARELVVRIIKTKGTDLSVTREACRLFVYVANADSRSEVLAFAKLKWPSMLSEFAMDALKDLGDDGLLDWVDQLLVNAVPGGPRQKYYEGLKRHVVLQKTVPGMLAYIQSNETGVARDWVVRQAMRHGATRGQVRAAAVRFLEKPHPVSMDYAVVTLIKGCDDHDIFTAQDVGRFEVILKHWEPTLSVGIKVPPTSRRSRARAAFYRLPQ